MLDGHGEVLGHALLDQERPEARRVDEHVRFQQTAVVGQYGLLYFLMWAAIRWTLLNRWERFGDFSYGIYIYAFPVTQVLALINLELNQSMPAWLFCTLAVIATIGMSASRATRRISRVQVTPSITGICMSMSTRW